MNNYVYTYRQLLKIIFSSFERHYGEEITEATISYKLPYLLTMVDWVDPTTVTGSSVPNLSIDGFSSLSSQVAVDSTGKYSYVVWQLESAPSILVQECNGIFTASPSPLTLQAFGSQIKVHFPFQIDLTNNIVWNDISEAILYRIYSDVTLTDLIAEISPDINKFVDHQIKKEEIKIYYVIWVDSDYTEHGPTVVTIP